MCPNIKDVTPKSMSQNRIFVAAWDFPPKMSGESVVCKRALEHSTFQFDVCSGCFDGVLPQMDNVEVYPRNGRYVSWPLRAARLFRTLDKRYHYRIMQSRVMPPQGHLAGLLIKLIKPSIKWVVYFSDPIWNSPFISFSSLFKKNTQQQPNYLLMKVFGVVAWVAIQYGDLLVFNNERLARYILGKQYLKMQSKVAIVPYGHDGVYQKEQPKNNQNNQRNKVVIAHVGQIYGARSFASLIAGLELLRKTQFEQFSRIEILQVGFTCPYEKEQIAQSVVGKSFHLLDEVDYESSLDYMKKSNYLLILDPYFTKKNKNVYVPIKIFDYMSVGVEIVAIADSDSATADIAKKMGFAMVGHEAGGIANMLLHCVSGGGDVHIDGENCFNCNRGVEILDEQLHRL